MMTPSATSMNLPLGTGVPALNEGRMQSLRARPPADPAQVEKIAQDFEAVFIHQMLEHMFSGVKADERFGGGHGEEMFRSVLLDEYAKKIAATGGVGVAQHVRNTLLGYQEVSRS